MINKETLKKIEEIAKEFFQKMTFETEIEVSPPEEQTIPINVKMEMPQVLIGERGETLLEIQRLLKTILKRKIDIGELFYIDLDINDYKKKKTTYLKELARSLAEEVALTKRETILQPMPAHERRIIHMELAGRQDVISESVGEEPERRITIKPYP